MDQEIQSEEDVKETVCEIEEDIERDDIYDNEPEGTFDEEAEKFEEVLDEAGYSEELKEDISNIDWSIVQYEPGSLDIIPVFPNEELDLLSNVQGMNIKQMVEANLYILRESVDEYKSTQYPSEEEAKKKMDEMIKSRDSLIAIFQSTLKSVKQITSKEFTQSVNIYMIAETLLLANKLVNDKDGQEKLDVYDIILRLAKTRKSIFDVNTSNMIFDTGFDLYKLISTLGQVAIVDDLFDVIDDHFYTTFYNFRGIIKGIIDNDESVKEYKEFFESDSDLKCKFSKLVDSINSISTSDKLKEKLEELFAIIDETIYKPSKEIFSKIINKTGKTQSIKNSEIKKFFNTNTYIDHLLWIKEIAEADDDVKLRNILLGKYIPTVFVSGLKELLNCSVSNGNKREFYILMKIQIIHILNVFSLLTKPSFIKERLSVLNESDPDVKEGEVKEIKDISNTRTVDILKSQDLYDKTKRICEDTEHINELTDMICYDKTVKMFYSDIIDGLISIIDKIKNDIEEIITTNDVQSFFEEKIAYGQMYMTVVGNTLKSDKNLSNRKRRRKHK